MFDIIQKDKELLIYLNNLGTEFWDPFWLAITNQLNWAPLFVLIIFLVIKSFGWKRGGFMVLAMIVLVAFSDQFTNLIKDTVQRIRPNNDLDISHLLRLMAEKRPGSFSFMSGHATTSTFFSVFVILLLREKYKYIYLLILFPLIFAYSRVYLGVHFPIDISAGIIIGTIFANLYYFLFKKLDKKIFN